MKIKNTYFFWGVQRSVTAFFNNANLTHKTITRLIMSLVLLFAFILFGCKTNPQPPKKEILTKTKDEKELQVGANQLEYYLPLLKGKKIAVVANQSSLLKKDEKYVHLVDTLLSLQIPIRKVFSPEHGFRGKADAGEKISNQMDTQTGLPIISLYGSHKKPTARDLKGIKLILFDLQDVGVRFYTYISTLHYVMEAAAENKIPVIVLDRPNPNAHYIDGPVLKDKFHSFVGMHPVPIVYGMTIGEYAQMINGQGWLRNSLHCDLQVIPLKNYTHRTRYTLPVKPSPNLPNSKAVNLYPSLCFFEGTNISCGRGTDKQFQVFGAPYLPKKKYPFSFIPQPNLGAKHPKYQGKKCNGLNLENENYLNGIQLQWLINAYAESTDKDSFFNAFFTKLAGTNSLQNQIELGYSPNDIKKTWQPDLERFKKIRLKYLLYD